MKRAILPRVATALALCALLAACGDDKPTPPTTGIVPDFALVDLNPGSASYQQSVSPRDYLQKVSAWYFGHAT